MRKYTFLVLALLMSAMCHAEQRMTIHGAVDNAEISVFRMKTIEFHDGSARFNGGPDTIIPVEQIDSLTFGDPVDAAYVQLIYLGDSVRVVNPYAENGLDISVNGADVTVASSLEDKNVTFYMKGYAEDGSFVITPSKKFNMLLDGLLLVNPDGPAVKILEDKEARITLADGSVNMIKGMGDGVDANAAVWSKTQIVFTRQLDADDNVLANGNNGSGSLVVYSTGGHGIYSSDYVRINDGTIRLADVAGDGINSKDYFEMNGGSLFMDSVRGDGIDCNDHIFINGGSLVINSEADDVKALKCDSMINILGGVLSITMTGDAAKAIKNDSADVRIENAKVDILVSGGKFVNDSEASYCGGIKTENYVRIKKSNIYIECTENAMGAKGINAAAGIVIEESSTVTIEANGVRDDDAASGGKVACLKTNGEVNVSDDSTVKVSCANEEAKGVSAVSAASVNGNILGYDE